MLYFILATLFLCSQAYVLSPVPQLDESIVRSSPIEIAAAPYHAAVLYDYFNLGVFTHICSGAIVGSRTILTVANCVQGTRDERWRIRAGSSFHNSGGVDKSIEYLNNHYFFTTKYDFDFTLVILRTSLVYGPEIARISLPTNFQETPMDATAAVTGWGILSAGNVPAPVSLHKTNWTTFDYRTCMYAYADYNFVTSQMLCLVVEGEPAGDDCQADYGSPAVIDGKLFGLRSWGSSCGTPDKPGVYSRVSSVRTWLDINIKN